MQDRFKFRYVFSKDFGGKTGICYKIPIFDLDTITNENFNKVIKEYTDYDYKLVSKCQCTGLKDKNGKLIYEGDIIKDELGYIRVCVYEDDRFRYPALKTSRYFHKAIKNKQKNRCEGLLSRLTFTDNLSKNSKSKFEIIGSIYENPELLKEVK